MGNQSLTGIVSVQADEKFWTQMVVMHNIVNVLNANELYNLKDLNW